MKKSQTSLFLFLVYGAVQAQTLSPKVTASGGGYATSVPASLSWTIGETNINTLQSGATLLTQGFEQPELDILTGAVPSPLCADATVTVSYTAAGYFGAANVFTAQLSDANGNFASPTAIGALSSTSSGIISCTIPANTPADAGYIIRVVSSDPAFTGSDNGSNITINVGTASTTSATTCNNYIWNGGTYTTSGSYVYHTTNAAGCDSAATLNLTINYSSISSNSATACNSYIWNGTTYTTSGSYIYHTANAVGCDSTATLHLTINYSSTSSTSQTSCNSYTWNGNTYTTSGSYSYHTTNATGCDSAATLHLTINYSSTSSGNVTACDSYSWNGNTYSASGSYLHHTTNTIGCDSIATMILTINYSTNSSIAQDTCGIYIWDGSTYTASGTYTYHTTNAVGCDSSAVLNLTISGPCTSTLNILMFIQGYYLGGSMMTPVLQNELVSDDPNVVDTIYVSLVDSSALSNNGDDEYGATVATAKGVLHVDGSVSVTFPGNVANHNYYVRVNHRNAVETWSALTITVSPITHYDFTVNASQAYGSNEVDVYEEGVWSFYSGDFNEDQNIDLYDYPVYNYDVLQFAYGYYATDRNPWLPTVETDVYVTDLNGDGNIDIFDYMIYEANVINFIYSDHP